MISKFIKDLQHIGIPTTDVDKTVSFFASLGFSTAHFTCTDENEVAFMTLNNICVEIYKIDCVAGKCGAIDHIALGVTDIEETWTAIRDAGFIPIENTIQFLPFWNNGVRFFNILGPNGEKIEFSQIL